MADLLAPLSIRTSSPSEPGMVAPDVPTFYHLGQQAVAEQDTHEPRNVRRRQRDHTDMLAQGREWQVDADRHDASREKDNRCRSAALNKGDVLGSDHVHDQRLREQTDHEPTGLEERLLLDRVGSKYVPHNHKRHDIEDGADRTDMDHEARNPGGVPLARLF